MRVVPELRKFIVVIGLIFMNFPLAKLITNSYPPSESYKEESIIILLENLYYVGISFIFLLLYLNFIAKDYEAKLKETIIVIINLGVIFIFLFNYPILSFVGLVLVLVSLIGLIVLKLKDKC